MHAFHTLAKTFHNCSISTRAVGSFPPFAKNTSTEHKVMHVVISAGEPLLVDLEFRMHRGTSAICLYKGISKSTSVVQRGREMSISLHLPSSRNRDSLNEGLYIAKLASLCC